jgi:hypothetical protein
MEADSAIARAVESASDRLANTEGALGKHAKSPAERLGVTIDHRRNKLRFDVGFKTSQANEQDATVEQTLPKN